MLIRRSSGSWAYNTFWCWVEKASVIRGYQKASAYGGICREAFWFSVMGWHKGDKAGRFAMEMGVPKSALIAKGGALDTGDEANLFVDILGTAPFALVTSAWHIPRAMKLFQARGLNPIAAPCEHRTKEFPPLTTCMLPSAAALLTTELAMHEYLGMVWLDLKETLTKLFW